MTEKARIAIALLLPEVPDARDTCIRRLGDLLKATEGIDDAHLADIKNEGPDQICIHYDPARLSIGEVRALAHRAGVKLANRFGHLLLKTEPMHARQARTVEARARKIAGWKPPRLPPACCASSLIAKQPTEQP